MSPTKRDRMIRSISGKTIPPQHVPQVIANALHREYDETTTVSVAGRKVYLGKPATSRIWARPVAS